MEFTIISGIQVNASGESKITVNVFVNISQVIFSLKNREINIRVINSQPGPNILIDGKQLLKKAPSSPFSSARIGFNLIISA